MTHELDALVPGTERRRKRVLDRILEDLGEDDRAAVLRALADRDRVSNGVIARWLTAHGHPISENAVRSWRMSR